MNTIQLKEKYGGIKMALNIGDKYLVLQIGDLKIPCFKAKDKNGKDYFKAEIKVFVNTKQASAAAQPQHEEVI